MTLINKEYDTQIETNKRLGLKGLIFYLLLMISPYKTLYFIK